MENGSGSALVELKNVSMHYGDVVGVEDISFEIREGEFFSLLGPSGCGKTTTLRMVGGFIHPTEGEIYIDGNLVNGIPPYERDTNLVFQQLALFPHMDVYDNIAFGLVVKRKYDREEIRKRVHRMLELVELEGLGDRRVQQISGGQKQRVAIARALINDPQVLLLDEPLGALDLKLRLQMQTELKKLQKRVGTTFIYVTHDQGEALNMSDRIAVMNEGHIEQIADSLEIYTRPATKFVAQFIGEINLFDGEVIGKEGNEVVVETEGLRLRGVTAQTEGYSVGDSVTLSIRPEKIKMAEPDEKTDADNVFYGKVTVATFMGSLIQYEVLLDNGLEISISMENVSDSLWAAGERTKVMWSKEHIHFLRE